MTVQALTLERVGAVIKDQIDKRIFHRVPMANPY
jgi:hypothetical protein